MRPARKYASSVWSPIASSTSINKLQVMQNAALITVTGCTQDTNMQHLHDETLTLPIHEQLQLHASQYKQKTQHPSHPLHKHTTYFNTARLKNTIFNNGRYTTNIPTAPHTVTTTDIKTNMRHIHTSIVSRHLAIRGNNKILCTPPPHISSSKVRLTRLTRRTIAQLNSTCTNNKNTHHNRMGQTEGDTRIYLQGSPETGSGICLIHMVASCIFDQHQLTAALRTATGCTQGQTCNSFLTKHSHFPSTNTYSSTPHN